METTDRLAPFDEFVLASRPRRFSMWRRRVAERFRNSLVVVPLLAVLVSWIAARLLSSRELNDTLFEVIDHVITETPGSTVESGAWVWFSASTLQTVTATVAAAMLTFIGVVFSLTILALQVASSQLSPRIMRMFVRSHVVTATLATFLATFVYALTVLSAIQPGSEMVESFEPFVAYYVLLVLVAATLVMFVCYVSHVVRLIRVHHVLDAVTSDTHKSLADLDRLSPREWVRAAQPQGSAEVVVAGRSGVVALVDTQLLVRRARRAGAVVVLCVGMGEHVTRGAPLFEVYGASRRVSPSRWRRCVRVASERTLAQDPLFGVRQVVDVGLRALSPAVNDPTTATQAIDRLVELVAAFSAHGDRGSVFCDKDGAPRLWWAQRSFADVVELAFSELCDEALQSRQTQRRLYAAFDELTEVVQPRHREAVEMFAAQVTPRWELFLERGADRAGCG